MKFSSSVIYGLFAVMQQSVKHSVKNKIRVITFCNTKKKNAISVDDYEEIGRILNTDAVDENINGTIFTGVGDYFSSGNDLSINNANIDFDMDTLTRQYTAKFVGMVNAFINYPKLIAAVINGPAIGIGFTIIALSDIAFASDTATFSAPFVKLGLCIEGCGSYLLPRILGKSKAAEVLLLGHQLSAPEALTFNLISSIVPNVDIPQCIAGLIAEISALPLQQVMYNKKLMTDCLKPHLLACAKREAQVLLQCQSSEYFLNNLFKFLNKKSKF